MKKPIAQSLRKLAETLPIIFEEQPDTVMMTGKELKLTPYADHVEDDKVYHVPIPKYVAVEHYQQMKDAVKRGGFDAVRAYVDRVMNNYQNVRVV